MKYKTKQKELIHSYFLRHNDSCITALELKEQLQGNKIGLTTIYRCLQELEKENIIRKYIGKKSQSATYEYINNTDYTHDHYHLKCTKCDTIIHLECANFKNLTTHVAMEHNFVISPMQTTLYGLCTHCTDK